MLNNIVIPLDQKNIENKIFSIWLVQIVGSKNFSIQIESFIFNYINQNVNFYFKELIGSSHLTNRFNSW
jgi:hypothetical protein